MPVLPNRGILFQPTALFRATNFIQKEKFFIMSNCIFLGYDMTSGLILLVNLGMV